MLTLLPILSLLGAGALIALLGVFRPRFVYHWLIAVLGAVVAWASLWVIRGQLPLENGPLESSLGNLPLPTLAVQFDAVTWPLALAIATVGLAVLFSDASRAVEMDWVAWAGDLGLIALGMVAVTAATPVTMLLAWTLVDGIELIILLWQVRREETRRSVLVFFSTNLLGTAAVIAGMIVAESAGAPLRFDPIPAQAQIYMLIAVGLRMGVFPLQAAFLHDVRQQRGQGTLLRLIPPAVSLSLLVHTAGVQTPANWRGVLLFFSVLSAVYGAIVWARARDELQGRVYWIIGTAGLAFSAAIQSHQSSALAWGLAMLYAGAYLFLSSVRTRRLLPVSILSLLTITSLPLTPTVSGLGLYQPFQVVLILLAPTQVILLVGYVRHMLRQTEPQSGVEPWARAVYYGGVLMLPVTFVVSHFLRPELPSSSMPLWPLILILASAGLGGVAYWQKISISDTVFLQLDKVFSLRWVYTVIGWGFAAVGRLVAGITFLLEGDGGVLWALVFLAMLLSLLGQVSAGGGL